MVAIPIIVTVAMRMPATITGSASGSSTLKRICIWVRPIPRGVYGLGRDRVEPRDDVADQDEERVGHQRDDDGRGPYRNAGMEMRMPKRARLGME